MLRVDSKIVCEEYLDFIRDQPCMIGNEAPRSQPHHLQARGRGEAKRNDFTSIPVCQKHHNEFEQYGAGYMCKAYNVDPWEVAARYLVEFVLLKNGQAVKIKRGKI